MEVFIAVWAGILGLLIGSFLNACAYRIPRHVSVARGRSMCPHCKAQIKGYDNIPLFSWLMLRGKCRACGAPIHWRYPLVEGLTCLLFAAVAWMDGASWVLLPHLIFVATLILVSDIDLEFRIIPNVVVLPVAAVGLALMTLLAEGPRLGRLEWLAAGLGAAALLLLASWVYEKLRKVEGMGMGDVKLAMCMGFYLGLAVIPAMFIGFVLGAVIGVALIARGRSGQDAIPFGPFLATGAVIALFWGGAIIDLYVRVALPQ
jgi:leader peptidase (prepilin peptidase) / N-methyltransferase